VEIVNWSRRCDKARGRARVPNGLWVGRGLKKRKRACFLYRERPELSGTRIVTGDHMRILLLGPLNKASPYCKAQPAELSLVEHRFLPSISEVPVYAVHTTCCRYFLCFMFYNCRSLVWTRTNSCTCTQLSHSTIKC
jgi:hypothetical protein